MRYEDFKATWETTLAASRLRRHGFTEETLDTRSLDRKYSVRVEPPRGQESKPFHVTAELFWRWTAMHTARTNTSEEDAVTELFGLRNAPNTAQPWMRVDVILSATLPYGEPIPLPSARAWSAWAKESLGRLENIEPLLPDERTRQPKGGLLEVLAWREEPHAEVRCASDGLQLAGLTLASGIALDLPRKWSSEDQSDEGPEQKLTELFKRLERALGAWGESLDHLRA